jgi:hypothetical protein
VANFIATVLEDLVTPEAEAAAEPLFNELAYCHRQRLDTNPLFRDQ